MRIFAPAILTTLAVAILAAAPALPAGRHDRCETAVEEVLARLRIDPALVGAISLQVRSHDNRDDNTRVNGIRGWVELRDCAGRLVLDMSPRCRVMQFYTRGGCTVPGAPAF